MSKTLLSLGHGYSARALATRLISDGWRIIATTRDPAKAEALRDTGVEPLIWPSDVSADTLESVTHMLVSAGPTETGDPVLAHLGTDIARFAPRLTWVGYLSTTAVYGDHNGGWVDETTPLTPSSKRGHARVNAEREWADIPNLPLHIFRLAGIYGPGRGPFAKVRAGTARRVIKPGQVFSRIHVEDIAQVLAASMSAPNLIAANAIYNLCDDDPAPPEDVIAHAAELLGLPIPPSVPFETAEMTPMARSFYGENKRVRNDRIKNELGIKLIYPGYREGLASMVP